MSSALPLQPPDVQAIAKVIQSRAYWIPGWCTQREDGEVLVMQKWAWNPDSTPYLPALLGPLVELLEKALRGKSRWGLAMVEAPRYPSPGKYRCWVVGEVEVVEEGETGGEAVARVIVRVWAAGA